ncbi:MAG: hypothetical protein LBS54_03710 [Dysgonamonadaceae bacterium]|jgi:hypothetical protein|nr:hypothetical protein [Dysgonamonadaceae bacterium]
MKKYFLIAVALLMISAGAKAQVTIGATTDPQSFSLLELVSNGANGLRLPQMTFCEREDLTTNLKALATQAEKDSAKGLQIFNIDTKCVETWNGSRWIQTCQPEGAIQEQILFTIKIDTDGDDYYIPTSGRVGNTSPHPYNWNVSVDGDEAVNYDNSTGSNDGIALTGLEAGTHQICITPHACPFTAGWGNAFGHIGYQTTGNANTAANKQKLISIDAPLTTMAFAPESTTATNASSMFAYMFYDCSNLTTGAKIADTYKCRTQ